MVKMPADVRETLQKQKPIPIATSSKNGTPNVVYIAFLKILDDENIMIGDNYFNKTAANLAENPRISILCYDKEAKRSFQIKGSTKVFTTGPHFEEMKKWVMEVNPKLPAKAAVMVRVDEIFDSSGGPNAGKKLV